MMKSGTSVRAPPPALRAPRSLSRPQHFSGVDEAVLRNITAAKDMSAITKTSFGPNGAGLATLCAPARPLTRPGGAQAKPS